jgi:hypothetical protein
MHCARILAALVFSLLAIPGASSAESGEGPREAGAPATVAAPSTEAATAEAPRQERAGEPPRSRPSDALMRALMVITSTGGNRPFPLVPR